MPIAKTERGKIFYKDYRKETNTTPLVLIHGAGGNYQDWPIELRKDAGAIALDLPGHGQSPQPARTKVDDYTADIVALFDVLEIESAIIAGHSMGGAIAQTIALDYPQYAKGLILIGTGAKLEVNSSIINGFMEKPEETARLVMRWAWAKHISEEIREESIHKLLETPTEVTHGDYIACNDFDVRERLGEITVPTLILAGTVDKMTPLALSQELAENIPNATLALIENGGHMFPLEQPEKIRDLVVLWMKTR
jgi:pimeloyl-ACP methyl ester carboxylesterase